MEQVYADLRELTRKVHDMELAQAALTANVATLSVSVAGLTTSMATLSQVIQQQQGALQLAKWVWALVGLTLGVVTTWFKSGPK